MADLNKLSSVLEAFDKDIYPQISSMKSSKDSLSSSLNNVSMALESSANGFSSSVQDSTGTELVSCINLCKSGVDAVKKHIDSDLDQLFNNCNTVKSIIDEINQKRAEGVNWQYKWYEQVWDDIVGIFTQKEIGNDTYKINKANALIDQKNKEGEAQLKAMSEAINSVKMGVAGNMVRGGTVGAGVFFGDVYTFDNAAWEKANPIYHSSLLTKTGSFVLGGVEGVVKIAEGVFDFGTNIVGNVVSIINADAGKAINDFAAKDLTGAGADVIANTLGLHDNGWRNTGKFVGQAVGHGVLWATGAGAIVSAVSIGGCSIESSLQNGDSGWLALGKGALSAVGSYAGGKIIQAASTKLFSWASNSAKLYSTGSRTVSARVGNAINNFGTIVGGTSEDVANLGYTGLKNIGAKTVHFAATPLRVYGKVITKGANKVNSALKNSKVPIVSKAWNALGNVDAKASTVANKFVDKSTKLFGNAANKVSNKASSVKSKISDKFNTLKDNMSKKSNTVEAYIDGERVNTEILDSESTMGNPKPAVTAGQTSNKPKLGIEEKYTNNTMKVSDAERIAKAYRNGELMTYNVDGQEIIIDPDDLIGQANDRIAQGYLNSPNSNSAPIVDNNYNRSAHNASSLGQKITNGEAVGEEFLENLYDHVFNTDSFTTGNYVNGNAAPLPDPVPNPVPDPVPNPVPDPVPNPVPVPVPDPITDMLVGIAKAKEDEIIENY